MAMTKQQFKDAFREAVSAEFAHIPTHEMDIPFAFSEKFCNRMEKLIRSQKKPYWVYVNTAAKRAALILALLFSLLASACAIKDIREPIVSFFTDIYDTYIRYIFEGETVDEITYEYTLGYVPTGYEQTDHLDSKLRIITSYQNETGELIEFAQVVTDNAQTTINNGLGNGYSIVVSDVEVKILEIEDIRKAFWIRDGYLLSIVTTGNLDMEILQEMILSVS